jgi:hypothetical protein
VLRSRYTVPIETKYLRLSNVVSVGDDLAGWRVCWVGGWDKFRVLSVVMVERMEPEADSAAASTPPI